MKKNVLNLMAITAFCCLTSCSEEMDDHLEQWMIDNIMAFNSLKIRQYESSY